MSNKCVVRNSAYRKGEFNLRERHNERKNESYGNCDIKKQRADLNIHFKKCEGTYEHAFNKMVKNKTISLRGLKEDAKVFNEFVFDVNTNYFEENGGYEYAKKFYEQAYKLAVKEAGGEEYVLSAVMHADERNKALSEKIGRDVYHYHLHVVYIPVVDKEIKWSKRCKDPELVGKIKEVIKQVSHSKKWSKMKQYDENGDVIRNDKGKAILINSYSLLQDRFYEHMQQAGFTDFERGKRGSTAKHLTDLEYKIDRDKQRLKEINNEVEVKNEQSEQLNKEVENKILQADKLNNEIQANEKKLEVQKSNFKVMKQTNTTFYELENMAVKNKNGTFILNSKNWLYVLNLAKNAVLSNSNINKLKNKIDSLQKDISIYKIRWENLLDTTAKYTKAKDLNPTLVDKLLDEVIDNAKNIKLQQNNSIKNKTKGYER